MELKNPLKGVVLGLGIVGLAACSSESSMYGNDSYARYEQSAPQAQTAGLGREEAFPGAHAGEVDLATGHKNNTIYFGFDSSRVKPEFQAMMDANAKYLHNHPDGRIRLEGHTDPRGSREYNVGLGQRRANQVAEQLALLGVSEQQMARVSYGKEKLAAAGNDDEAYQLDRRVEVIYEMG